MQHQKTFIVIISLVTMVSTLIACNGTQGAPEEAAAVTATAAPNTNTIESDENAEIVVWVDEGRQEAVKRYQELHPDVADQIKIEVVNRRQFPGKVLLFNNVGSGWPDVFFGEPDIIAKVADVAHNFPADLSNYVPQEILDNYPAGVLESCTFDGKLYCLRHDLSQIVLYYNKPLMDEFGYDVPTTWEAYEALGEQVATEHPGYVMGTIANFGGVWSYFWPSRCPLTHVKSVGQIQINALHPNCLRAAGMVDRMMANGTITPFTPFQPEFVEIASTNKLLMLPAGSWFGQRIFGGHQDGLYYKTAEGQLGVALMPRWNDADTAWTGAWGGSSWSMSRHTKNPKLAADLIMWLSTAIEFHETASTYPAYLPAAEAWSKSIAANPLYAFDPYPTMKEAASLIDPQWGNVRFDERSAYNTVIGEAILAGDSLESALPALQETLVSLAEEKGYEVITDE